MSRRLIFPLILGLVGAATLLALGVWQLQRLAWKNGLITQIETRLDADPVQLPSDPTQADDQFLSVEVGGQLVGPEIHVLTSIKGVGPGYRVIQRLDTLDGRAIMADLGFVPEADKDGARQTGAYFLRGNLVWPNEKDGFIADPNFEKNIWFARVNEDMADKLGTKPLLVVVSGVTPSRQERMMPVQANLTNDHLQYAITWFALMAVWIGMTLFLVYRIKRYETSENAY